MVFTGIPVYLDPPNWQRHEDQQAGESCAAGVAVGGGGIQSGNGTVLSRSPPLRHNHSVQILQRPVPEMIPATTATASSSRPILMAERARLAKVPPPDTSLKCPRCESTNTKFCYYNNYSLTQPRHFCKTCRRYWTKGGALRNVPVGGGCRRNKRNKSNTSSTTNCQGSNMGNRPQMVEAVGAPTSSGGCATLISSGENIIGGIDNNPPPPIPFLPTIHGFNDYNSGTDIGLSFPSGRDLVMANTGNSLGLDFMSPNEPPGEGGGTGGLGQWRMQRYFSNIFPRQDGLPHMEPQLLLPFEDEGLVGQQYVAATTASQQRIKPTTHLNMNHASLKMEDNQHQNIGYWNSNAWGAELSNFPSTASNSFV